MFSKQMTLAFMRKGRLGNCRHLACVSTLLLIVSLVCRLSLNRSLPALLEKGKENFRDAATPKALLLLLALTFQDLKNSGGIHHSHQDLSPADFQAQKC